MAVKRRDDERGVEKISVEKISAKNKAPAAATATGTKQNTASAVSAQRATTATKTRDVSSSSPSSGEHGGSAGSFAAPAAQKQTGRRVVDLADLKADIAFAKRIGAQIDVGRDAVVVDTTARRGELAGIRRQNDERIRANERTIGNYEETLKRLAARSGGLSGVDTGYANQNVTPALTTDGLLRPTAAGNAATEAEIQDRAQMARIRKKIAALRAENKTLSARTNDAMSELSFLKISASGDADAFEQLYNLGYEQQGNRAATWAESQTGGPVVAAQSAAGRGAQTEKQISALRKRLLASGYTDDELDGALRNYKHYRNLQEKARVQGDVMAWMDKSPVNEALANVASAAAAPARSIMSLLKIADRDSASRYDLLAQVSEAVQGKTRDDIERSVAAGTGSASLGRAVGRLYAAGVSTVESLITMQTGGKLGELIMGLGAAGTAYSDARDRGLSEGRALVNAAAAGAFETIFEHLSLEKLRALQATPVNPAASLKKQIVTGILNTGKQMLTEGSEEFATEAANEIFDYLVNGGASKYLTYVRDRVDQGADEATAKKEYGRQFAGNLWESLVVGALSGGLSAGTVQTATGLENLHENRQIGDAVRRYAADRAGGVDALVGEMRDSMDADTAAAKRLEKVTGRSGDAALGAATRNFMHEAVAQTARDAGRVSELERAKAAIDAAATDAAADLRPHLERIGLHPAQAGAVSEALRKLAGGEKLTENEERNLAAQQDVIAETYMRTLAAETKRITDRTALFKNLTEGIEAVEDARLKSRLRKKKNAVQAQTSDTEKKQTAREEAAPEETAAEQEKQTAAEAQPGQRTPLAADLMQEEEAKPADPVYRETAQRVADAAAQGETAQAVRAGYAATDADGNRLEVSGVRLGADGRMEVVIDRESGAGTAPENVRFTGPEADEARAVYDTLAEMTAGRYVREDAQLAGTKGSYNAPLSAESANAALAYLAETPDVDVGTFMEGWYQLYTLGKTGGNLGLRGRIGQDADALPVDVATAAYRSGRSEREWKPGVTRLGTTPLSDAAVFQLQVIDAYAREHGLSVLATEYLTDNRGRKLSGSQTGRRLTLALFSGRKDAAGRKVARENLLELTAYHEATHTLREMDEASYRIVHDWVFDSLRETLTAEEYRELYDQRVEAYGDADLIEEEITAQFLAAAKTETDNRRLQAAIEKDPGAWGRFVEALKKVVAQLREKIRELAKTDRTVAAALRTDAAVLEKMTETFDAMLKEATQARDETAAAGTEAKENPAGEGREKHSKIIDENERTNVYKKRKRRYTYNETETNFMIWSNSEQVEVGEVRSFKRFGQVRYYEKTESGAIEVSKNQFEMIMEERIYENDIKRAADLSHEDFDENELYKRRSVSDLPSGGDSGSNAETAGRAGAKELRDSLQRTTADRAEDRRGSDRGDAGRGLTEEDSSDPKGEKERDAEYLTAVQKGDLETAQRMVDEAAKRAGYSKVGEYYIQNEIVPKNIHPTKNQQYFFDLGRRLAQENKTSDENKLLWAMENDDLEILAMQDSAVFDRFFKAGIRNDFPSYRLAIRFGDVPENYRSRNWATNDLERGVSAVNWLDENSQNEKTLYDMIYGLQGTEKIIIGGWDFGIYGSDGEPLVVYPEKITEVDNLKKIKLAKITYDDEGNVIPLSERFNAERDDIRYSVDLEAEAEEALEREAEGDVRVLEAQDVLRRRTGDVLRLAAENREQLALLTPKENAVKKITDKYNFSEGDGRELAGTVTKMVRNLLGGRVGFASFMQDLTGVMRVEVENAGHWEDLDDPTVKEFKREYRNKGIYLSPDIFATVAESYGGRRALRRATFGRVNVTDDAGKGYEALDTFYDALRQESYGFPETTDPGTQLQEILNRFATPEKVWVDDAAHLDWTGDTAREIARDKAMELLAEILKIIPDGKDKGGMDGVIALRETLRAEREAAVRDAVRDAQREADDALHAETEKKAASGEMDTVSAERYVAAQRELREKDARIRAIRDTARRRLREAERRQAAEKEAEQLRRQIRQQVRRMNRLLLRNENSENVPEELKSTALGLLRLFEFDSGIYTAAELDAIRFEYARIQKGIEAGEEAYAHKAPLDRLDEDAMEALNKMLDDLKTRRELRWKKPRPYLGEEASHHKARVEALKKTFSKVDAIYIRDLTLEEARIVSNAVETISHYIAAAGDVLVNGRNESAASLSLRLEQECERKKKRTAAARIVRDLLDTYMLTPTYFFNEKIGGVMRELFEPFMDAQDAWARRTNAGKAAIAAAKKKYNYKKWKDESRVFTFTGYAADTDEYWDVKLDVEAMLQIYALAKRERLSGQQSSHLITQRRGKGVLTGGVVLSERLQAEQKKLALAMEKQRAERRDRRADRQDAEERPLIHDHRNAEYQAFLERVRERNRAVIEQERHLLNENDIKMIEDALTEEQKAYADEIVRYMSTETSKWGNEATLQQWGIRKFGEGYYFPFETPDQFTSRRYGLTDDTRLKNWGASKQTVRFAGTPLAISGFSEVAAAHIQEMATYASFLTPIETMTAVLNYNDRGKTGNARTALTNAYGRAAEAYVADFLTAVNGGMRSDSMENIFNKMTGRFKAAAVMANASVVVQQPTSLMRAMAMINPKYFAGTWRFWNRADYLDMMEHAPVAIVKEMGGFDTSMGRSAAEWMLDDKSVGDRISELMGKGAELADRATWVNLWNAVKRETRDKHPDAEAGSDAFYEICNRRFRDIVNYTQVYDSVLAKSMLMRSKSGMVKMATAFMAEPTLSYNLLTKSGGYRTISRGRAIAAFLCNIVINSIAQGIVGAWRDKDEDETYVEKLIEASVGNLTGHWKGEFGSKSIPNFFLDGAWNPLGMIPYAKDLLSIFEGYDVDRSDVSVVGDMIKSGARLVEKSVDGSVTLDDVLQFGAQFTGLTGFPLKNVYRDITGLWNTARIHKENGWKPWYITRQTAVASLINGLGMEKSEAERAYYAVLHGDAETLRRLQAYGDKEIRAYEKKGYSEADARQEADDAAYRRFHSLIINGLRAVDGRVMEAAVAFYEAHDYALYQEIVEQITRDGFIRNDVKAAVDREIEAMRPKESEADDRTEKPLFTRSSLRIPVEAGDKAGYLNMKRLLLDAGETEEDLNGEAQRAIRDQYKPGDINYDTAVDRLVTFAGYDRTDAQNKVEVWKIEGLTETSLDDKVILGYVEKLKDSGIDFETFEAFYKAQAACEGERDANGRTKSGSQKAQILLVIDSMPISPAQKDALYYYKGWKASTIYEAPWH